MTNEMAILYLIGLRAVHENMPHVCEAINLAIKSLEEDRLQEINARKDSTLTSEAL